jgi:hypothetical protein
MHSEGCTNLCVLCKCGCCGCSSYGSHFYAGEAAAAHDEDGSEQGMPEGDDDEELDDEELARRLQSQEMGMAHGHMQGLAGLGEWMYRQFTLLC